MKISIKKEHAEAIIIKDEEGVRIDSLEVDSDHRRAGIGRQLLIEAIEEAKKVSEDGHIYIVADSKDEDFETADLVEFYEDEGFYLYVCECECPVLRMDI